ncbi:MAG: hypothetical protein A2W09_01650 [Deltaproteobacteria bacterium RBG_16_50_11]|nr:MAG: hypothetical protein A2W09_01650 [Deltaproteobacteria bacterium RBG_16_50_11]
MELKVLESPGAEWDEFASRYTDLIFYQSVWSEVLRKGLGGQPLYFCLEEGKEIAAGLPGVLLDFKIFKVLYASIPYGNMIGEVSCFQPFAELLNGKFRKMGIHQVRITDSPFSNPFPLPHFKEETTTCTLLDLRGLDKEGIWNGYKKYIRRDIRKGQRSGVTIQGRASGNSVKTFYELYLATMERNRAMAKYPFRWFETLYEEIVKRRSGDFLIAEWNGTPIAGVVLIHSSTTLHYFHNGSRPEFLRLCPNELLVHFSLEKAIEQGDSSFDFMGSDRADLSLIKFKEKWGGHSVDLNTYVKDYHALRSGIWEWGKRLGASRIGRGLLGKIRH